MTDLHRKGQRICGALSLFLTFSLPAFAQDLRLPLLQGQPDLALFALSRSESEISAPGRFLLERQGFYHRPGAGLQKLTSGLSLSPTLRHDPNINDGIPADRVTLGGLPFIVAPESRAKEAVLLGLQLTGWQSWSYAPGARLRLSHSLNAELEPKWGYHHAAANLRLCAEQPVASWTWADACLSAGAIYDGTETKSALTATLGARHLFQTGAGFHQLNLGLGATATDDYGKDVVQLSHLLLTENTGMWSLGYAWGEEIKGENTLRRRLALDWTGEVANRIITLSLSETRTGGASVFGIPREDHRLRAGVSVPVGEMDLGAWVERSGSSIDAWRGSDFGLSIGFRMNLL